MSMPGIGSSSSSSIATACATCTGAAAACSTEVGGPIAAKDVTASTGTSRGEKTAT